MSMVTLAPVRDVVSLSSRESAVFFDLERNGQLTLSTEDSLTTYEPVVLARLETDGTGWAWQDGWLPILKIADRYRLFALDDELMVQDGDRLLAYPSGRPVTGEDFEAGVNRIRKYWTDWFAAGLELPAVHPRLDAAWRSSLIQALCTFYGRHSCYGALFYRHFFHDSFPPNVITMTRTLLQFRHEQEAVEILLYYFRRFVRADGTIDYYGPSLAEYGALLSTAAMAMQALPERAEEIAEAVRRMIQQVLSWFNPFLKDVPRHISRGADALLSGSPEADESEKGAEYFHNNYQILRGLNFLAPEMMKAGDPELSREMLNFAKLLQVRLDRVFTAKKKEMGGIPFFTQEQSLLKDVQSNREVMYANYRYHQELLETGYLSQEDALECIRFRETHNGEYHGMTLFTRHGGGITLTETDNWPMGAYARALLEYGQRERFMRVLAAQFRNYISSDVYTAYEQVLNDGNPRKLRMPACVPVQLLLPRMLAWSYSYRKWDGQIVQWGGPTVEELQDFDLDQREKYQDHI